MQADRTPMPQFARSGRTGEPTVELRGECARSIVNVVDAVSMARDKTRSALVEEILGEWAAKVLHEHSLIQKVAGLNPAVAEASGGMRS